MAFKTLDNYNEERNGNFFTLKNDGDTADVIFLYQSSQDALVADVHYLKSGDYSGYAHCLGRGCPACGKDIRIQTKLFIPLYNLTTNRVEFWDRTTRFEPQLQSDVFKNFPNPSEFVFRITRKGQARDVNTVYTIAAIAKNTFKSYSQILADCGVSMPEGYSMVCKDLNVVEMSNMLNNSDNVASSPMQDYSGYGVAPRPASPGVTISTPTFSEPPTSIPGISSDMMPNGEDEDNSPEPEF